MNEIKTKDEIDQNVKFWYKIDNKQILETILKIDVKFRRKECPFAFKLCKFFTHGLKGMQCMYLSNEGGG